MDEPTNMDEPTKYRRTDKIWTNRQNMDEPTKKHDNTETGRKRTKRNFTNDGKKRTGRDLADTLYKRGRHWLPNKKNYLM